ncbi:STM3941 family protein [Nocardiopsis gilva]|nr:STM3941 family protein [Nocardiopsis gilva]
MASLLASAYRNVMRSKAGTVLAFVVMTVLSGLLALAGDVSGYFGLLFFGGLGVVYLIISRRPRRAPVAADDSGIVSGTHVTLSGANRYTTQTVGMVFPGRQGFALAVTVGSAIFVAAGVVFVVVGMTSTMESPGLTPSVAFIIGIGAVSIAFFGLCGVLGLRSLLGVSGGIALLPEGIYVQAPAGRAWVRWQDLAGAYVGYTQGQAHIALCAKTSDAIELSGLNQRLHGLNRKYFGMDVGYPGQYLHVSPDTVVSAIHYYWQNPQAREQLPDLRN